MKQWLVVDGSSSNGLWTPRPLLTPPTLVGRHVRVDPFNATTDVPLLWEALGGSNDENSSINDLLKWWGLPDLASELDLRDLLLEIQQPDKGCWVNVFRLVSQQPANDQVCGMACYINTRSAHGSTEVGYVAHGAAMRQTPASTEAHLLLASHVFDTMHYRRYEWKCDSNNMPSGKAAVRYGFTYEGCFRQHVVTARGHNRDTNWYSMLDTEWEQRKAALQAWLHPSNFDATTQQQKRQLQEFQKECRSSTGNNLETNSDGAVDKHEKT